MTIYINVRMHQGHGYWSNHTETIDECETRKEALYLVGEYRLAMPDHRVWVSQRSTKDWRNKQL